MNNNTRAALRRLIACLAGGFVLALMVGNQAGTFTDFGVAFFDAVKIPRIFIFLAIGFVIFLLITFWPLAGPYLTRPGTTPLGAGVLIVIAAHTIMNWYDPLVRDAGNGKFGALRSAVDSTAALSSLTVWFFDWLAWTLVAVAIVMCAVAIVTRLRVVGYLTAAVGVTGAVLAYLAHADVVNVDGRIDHSLGVYADIIGYLVIAGAGLTAVRSRSETSDTRGFFKAVMSYRPGLPFAVGGLILGLFAYTIDGWFGPLRLNATFAQARGDFAGLGLSGLATQYLAWLGWLLFAGAALTTLLATYLRHRMLAWVGAAVSVLGIVLTFFTLKSMTDVGAAVAPEHGASWQNLGAGGFVACIAYTMFAASVITLLVRWRPAAKSVGNGSLPITAMIDQARTSPIVASFLVLAIGVALFYPPTLPSHWQSVLVTSIGVYVLLALGLNVVVGWAGLLDLGYIAFFEVGAYTTAYLVGALPVKPPSWLLMPPLLAIPFAVLACLIAGVLLGAPTLRLRGDYLAIVTLGFGEIIQILATNNPGGFTGGPQGPTVPHPQLHLGGLNITWVQNDLMYWYLLLVMLVVVIVLFWRLEGSRLGRAWAAIREDEVAAQATGVNTTRAKLLAFSIGASTSGLAGWYFATRIGYFDPSLFTLQTSILIVAYVVFGGMGSLAGAMAGAAALTWLPEFLKDQVPQNDRQMWIGALVLAMMIFRPAGLLPARRRKAELEGLDEAPLGETMAVPRAGAV